MSGVKIEVQDRSGNWIPYTKVTNNPSVIKTQMERAMKSHPAAKQKSQGSG